MDFLYCVGGSSEPPEPPEPPPGNGLLMHVPLSLMVDTTPDKTEKVAVWESNNNDLDINAWLVHLLYNSLLDDLYTATT